MSTEPTDPMALAGAQAEQFWQDLEAEFGLLTESEAAQALGVNEGEVARLRQAGALLAVDRSGEDRYPGFQVEGGRPLPLITRLAALRAQYELSERETVYWLCAPTTYFRDERRPVDHLDDPDAVVAAADGAWGVVW